MFSLSSPAFVDGDRMPVRFAANGVPEGRNLSPPLVWQDAPPETRSFALMMIDHHPIARRFMHWLAVNIPADVLALPEGASGRNMPPGAGELANTTGMTGYWGPRPPAGSGDHDYVFTVYALDAGEFPSAPDTSLSGFEETVREHTLAEASITVVFAQPVSAGAER